MQLVLERRAERSALIAIASPLIAVALTLVTVAVLFEVMGKSPITALSVYFLGPLTDAFSLQEIAVKANVAAFRAWQYCHQSSTAARPPPSAGRHRFPGRSMNMPMPMNRIPWAMPSFTHFISVSARAAALISVVCGLELVAEITSYISAA